MVINQANMPVETQQLGTAALGSWAAIRMKTQVLPQMTAKCEKNSFLFCAKKVVKIWQNIQNIQNIL